MADVNWFKYLHTYRALAADGKAKPILCKYDGREYVIGHDNGDPVLVCYTCDSRVKPGLDLLEKVRAVVREHVDI